MNTGRRFLLDLVLSLAVGVFYYFYAAPDTESSRRLYHAILLSVGIFLFVRFFIRRFFMSSPLPTPDDFRRQLAHLEAQEPHYSQWNREQQINFLQQAGALALALELWPQVIRWFKLLVHLLEQEQHDHPESSEESQTRWFHVQFSLSFALMRHGQSQEGLERLHTLRQLPFVQKQPFYGTLLDLFEAKLAGQRDPEQGRRMLQTILDNVQQGEYEVDTLRLLAIEWSELGESETAILLLQKAVSLAAQREDRETETDLLYQLGHAYGDAGHLPQAAEVLVQLTRRYVQINYPSSAHIEQLRQKFCERFGTRNFQTAYHRAEKQLN